MRCSECGQTNIAGSLFCEQCGAELAAELVPAASPAPAPVEAPAHTPEPAAPAPPPPAGATRRCPHCERDNPAEHVVCEACGRSLRETTPVLLPPSPTGDAPVPAAPRAPSVPLVSAPAGQLVNGPQKGKVKLVVEQGLVVGKQFLLTGDDMLVGREDASESLYPELDLSGLDEGFVHRRHARLTFEGSFLFVTHLGGHNRTYVNNRPIADGLAHPLNVGDTVRFGKVVLRLVEA